ncbi:hypothetical protein [Flavobacterium tegetincola]|uniref:hypothetical protein n=1 Tax=Flavobacterium tegetincola TaxID=150172 RepID=UPI000426FE95|nr:hypothetical protein [Flavobacterium tegetincola]
MKKYVFFTVIAASIFLSSCTTDDLDSSEHLNMNIDVIQESDSVFIFNDSLTTPPGTAIPPVIIGRDD